MTSQTAPEPATPQTDAGRQLDRALATADKLLPVGYADKYRAAILAIEAEMRALVTGEAADRAAPALDVAMKNRTGEWGARLGAFEDLARELVGRWDDGTVTRPEAEIVAAFRDLLRGSR